MQPSAANPVDYSLVESLAKNQHRKAYDGVIQYGTAGFRTKADILDHVLFRMGLLTVLRSQVKKAAIGLMITASHNPEADNGVKLVDPNGEMLESSWETIATRLANVQDSQVVSTLQEIIKEQNIDTSYPASVIIGRDTRSSSLPLSQAAVEGVKAMNGNLKDFGVVTTPQLHYVVHCTNTNGAYGVPTVEGYYEKISKAFKTAVGGKKDNDKYIGKVQIDAANGVGALAVKEFKKQLSDVIDIQIYNDGNGQLNHMCGADYVKIQQIPPVNDPLKPLVRSVSIDGDADRIVYYYTDENNKFHLLDGDRIAILVAAHFKELLEKSNLDLQLGLVQTAYANGGSTAYISETLKVPVACVPTGVKHLHHKALEFDIGVYFEANGHGTIVFKDSAVQIIRTAADNPSLSENQRTAAHTLSSIIDVINQTVGDALSDMLLVELILRAKGWDTVAWEKSYRDLPNRQVKVKVQDRNAITTTDAERRCVTPMGLQEKIDEIVAKYPKGRSFVRPSGTEDVVRVYAECDRIEDVEKLAAQVSIAVFELAGGIGTKPVVP
ncbi:phosphoacetylglucosamine mutase [Nasonia vitripennis]|uniref:Phosphoacetylglucosamine mutase n=1 Tax=Nasonia vitripennis TaxID=7425 RepID=A0A7M7IQB0_NASVI|nr:phosphoacetylglucosamine mutase [Nasonia vitripennis]XP_016837507.1 phosphoacetylglucosamine mutase [Nasonia vitripennis]